MTAVEPAGRRPRHLTASRIGVYAFLASAALFFLLPLWIMLVTSLKPMEEVRLGNILAWPTDPTVQPWITAWSTACTGLLLDLMLSLAEPPQQVGRHCFVAHGRSLRPIQEPDRSRLALRVGFPRLAERIGYHKTLQPGRADT